MAENEKLLTESVTGTQNIQNESDAIEYARSLWKQIRINLVDGDYSAYRQDNGDWYVSMTVDGQDTFSAFFKSNGVIGDIAQNLNDYRWLTDGKYNESTFIDAQELADVETWIADRLTVLVPGLMNELREFQLNYVRDVGDAKYIFLSADPKDSTYDSGLSIFIRLNEDHSCVLLELQLAGNG